VLYRARYDCRLFHRKVLGLSRFFWDLQATIANVLTRKNS